ncbi:MAG: hypothetical protein CMM53_06250 [Rhodospirillaceae bacterium]|nr:hypothetical protein [Rhodospirillaceae bacterium]|tara:strand:- start:201 stop:584 length:384 start_codon:yes stop_codon:yes gene_type:complete
MLSRIFIVVSIFLLGYVSASLHESPKKSLIKFIYANEFAQHSFNCDNAMRSHFISKAMLAKKPTKNHISLLDSAELSLIDCHHYDKFRKKLLSLGLDRNDLSAMFLKSLEQNKSELSAFVKEHEIRY